MIPLFWAFVRIGGTTFGGGPSAVPMMQAECVGAGWVSESEFLEGLALGNALPGPIATKMALYVGWYAGGGLGAVTALTGLLLPSTLLLGLVGSLAWRFREVAAVAAALNALKPAVVGMLFFAAFDLAATGVSGGRGWAVAVAAAAALGWNVHPLWVVVGAVLFGVLVGV